ncbi:MAG: hypothetical protein ACTHOO_04845 [Alcanivorax sp.]
MNEQQITLLKNLFNNYKIEKIEPISDNTVVFDFTDDIRLFIDSTSSGVDFSLQAMTDNAKNLIEDLE